MINIFNYTDYRLFIKDVYLDKKDRKKSFSFRVFSDQVGFSSKSFIQDVISGKRNLSKDSAFKLIEYFEFDVKRSAYFQDLIEFDQAKNVDQKEFFLSRIVASNRSKTFQKILKEQYEFYSIWYNNTIRELITIPKYGKNLKLLGKMLEPQQSEAKVKKSVQLMLDLGLLKKTNEGYCVSSATITTGDEVASTLVSMFHSENFKLAERSMSETAPRDRDLSCVVIRLSKDGYQNVKDEVQEFRKRILQMESPLGETDKVFHFNMQLFPTTRSIGGHV